jgi:L-alanine-DL-glutamate epimerase-like enolase superfamily enzyme
MAKIAMEGYRNARALKLKLTGEPIDAERLKAVRAARPDAWIGVDANQGFTPQSLETLMPVLVETGVSLIEQPFPVGRECDLDGLHAPIPIAADESVQSRADLESLQGRFDIINIKLDKCGGFTEGLRMVRDGRRLGFGLMVGNMVGTSIAMGPAWLVGQSCDFADLDGPLPLREDVAPPVIYRDGYVSCSARGWGNSR